MFGHVRQLAEAEKRGVEAAGGTADLFQSVKKGLDPQHCVLIPSE